MFLLEKLPQKSCDGLTMPKGKASGWIEERVENKNKKKPSVSSLYKWEDSEGKHSLYIKAAKVARVREMVYGESDR
jgi:hypothetical protein